ncbi:F-box domain protein [Aspergillus clavatus NRRL 1]|uniref:F-box domain protein n=1 Tax=Aspergillus clavatus (strain ATCC 1007 / CBS 513.65 / DSM 816 / NCTC 3887 / NRRL 1 / QM 1276 / 107) TaxID=344612 RepID=A1CS75_ASPCL|nr:F-box domain protein [Aspergillus clavatus NRRL 1]EAW08496.1 F-box domain protein [Aspergillus clavatus NRRL 1]
MIPAAAPAAGVTLVCQMSPVPAANITPPEILLQIFYLLGPRDFDNARRTCSQWMRVSLCEDLLEGMLRRAGWWDAWRHDCEIYDTKFNLNKQSLVWRMSRRFATECLLSGRESNVERAGFMTTGVMDFSRLSQGQPTAKHRVPFSLGGDAISDTYARPLATSKFHVSNCSNYLLVTCGCMIYVYRLFSRYFGSDLPPKLEELKDFDIAPVSSITCPVEVISATIDTSTPKMVVAALLRERLGLVCDLVESRKSLPDLDILQNTPSRMRRLEPTSMHYFRNICSLEDPPRSVSICPGRRCVAFGSLAGVELHWVDEKTKLNQKKQFPTSQPSEILHFLPDRPGTSHELRIISSLAGPGMPGCECYKRPHSEQRAPCQFHLLTDVQSFTRWIPSSNSTSLSVVRATHCHHYRAIPVNDGLHILFIEPRTGSLCIGSDAPIGGPTSLTRALVCVPPFEKNTLGVSEDNMIPTVFASGWNLEWGLRVVAAYGDRIVMYSVPLDVFNVIRKERERQGDGVMGDSDLARDWFLDQSRPSKRRDSLVQNQNGDWDFLLSVSYRPTAMMWPFKIYGKEIARMENVVELGLQTSFGGARVWAFSASGETNIIDIDTFTSRSQRLADMSCRSTSVGVDGSIVSALSVSRTESGLLSAQSSRKRKPTETRDDFGGQQSAICRLPRFLNDGYNISAKGLPQTLPAVIGRRPSFAACIVDFKIPELGPREGAWVDRPLPRGFTS